MRPPDGIGGWAAPPKKPPKDPGVQIHVPPRARAARRGDGHAEGDPRPEDQPAERVSPELVGAEQELRYAAFHPRGRQQAIQRLAQERVLRSEPRGKQRPRGDDKQDASAGSAALEP